MKACIYCGSTEHTGFTCFQRPRRALTTKRKQINRIGPVAAKWRETRAEWIQRNASKNGKWTCYLQISPNCPKTLTIETLTLDHIKSRSRHPELRFVQSNLAPCCWPCNTLKGSREMEGIIYGRN